MGFFDDIFNRDKTKTSNFDFRLTQDNMHLMKPDVVYGISKMESLLPPNMRMGTTPDESKQKLNKIFGMNSDYKSMLDDYNGLGHPGKYARDYAAYYSAGRTGESFDHMAKEYSNGGFIPDAIKKAFQHGKNAKNNIQQQQSDKKPVDNPPDMGYNSENENKSSDLTQLLKYEQPKFLSSPAANQQQANDEETETFEIKAVNASLKPFDPKTATAEDFINEGKYLYEKGGINKIIGEKAIAQGIKKLEKKFNPDIASGDDYIKHGQILIDAGDKIGGFGGNIYKSIGNELVVKGKEMGGKEENLKIPSTKNLKSNSPTNKEIFNKRWKEKYAEGLTSEQIKNYLLDDKNASEAFGMDVPDFVSFNGMDYLAKRMEEDETKKNEIKSVTSFKMDEVGLDLLAELEYDEDQKYEYKNGIKGIPLQILGDGKYTYGYGYAVDSKNDAPEKADIDGWMSIEDAYELMTNDVNDNYIPYLSRILKSSENGKIEDLQLKQHELNALINLCYVRPKAIYALKSELIKNRSDWEYDTFLKIVLNDFPKSEFTPGWEKRIKKALNMFFDK